MAKKTSDIVVKSKLQETMDRMNKTYGIGTVLTLDGNSSGVYDVIPTGSIGFDYITLGIGGFAKGKLYEIMGWEGCLAEDTHIKFINVRPDGIVQDCKGASIKNLYERFHNRTEKTLNTEFNVTSINEEDRVFRNPIVDVVKSGVKECFELTTTKGYKIKSTGEHKYYTGTNYVALKDLTPGDIVFIHDNTPFKKHLLASRKKYKETTIKWHYKGKARRINGSLYFREKVHRLVYEANMNGISYVEYVSLLNKWDWISFPSSWNTIPDGYDVHHIDEDTTNNDISNLELLDNSSHDRHHALEKQNNLRFIVVPDYIFSIESVGEVETYDIKCAFPYNNFIAEGIVVHNSGKSTVCGHATAECQKAGGTVLYIDGEHAVDKPYFQSLGVDTTKLLIAQPSTGEEGFNVAVEMIKTGEIDLVIIDSDSSLIPKAVIDGDVGESSIGKKARLNNNAYPKLKSLLIQYKTCMIVISQYREKIGVMFGNPTTTQGGHALKFYTDCRIEITKSMAKDGDVNYGNITKVKATKNKMCPPYRVAQFEVVWGKGIDKIAELVELAVEYEIINKSGSWYSYGDTKLGQGTSGVTSLFEDNPELCDEIRQQVIDKLRHTEDLPIDETSEEETILAMANV